MTEQPKDFSTDLTAKAFAKLQWVIKEYRTGEITRNELYVAVGVICEMTQGLINNKEWEKLYSVYLYIKDRLNDKNFRF